MTAFSGFNNFFEKKKVLSCSDIDGAISYSLNFKWTQFAKLHLTIQARRQNFPLRRINNGGTILQLSLLTPEAWDGFPWEMKEIFGIYQPGVKLINASCTDERGPEC